MLADMSDCMLCCSGSKMMATEGQTVYMLVDRAASSGSGAVVGMLKVGRKKLFLMDRFEAGDIWGTSLT